MILPICRIQLTTGKLGERQTGKGNWDLGNWAPGRMEAAIIKRIWIFRIRKFEFQCHAKGWCRISLSAFICLDELTIRYVLYPGSRSGFNHYKHHRSRSSLNHPRISSMQMLRAHSFHFLEYLLSFDYSCWFVAAVIRKALNYIRLPMAPVSPLQVKIEDACFRFCAAEKAKVLLCCINSEYLDCFDLQNRDTRQVTMTLGSEFQHDVVSVGFIVRSVMARSSWRWLVSRVITNYNIHPVFMHTFEL